jgi:polysaccharide biosynthesis protein PslG
MKRVAWSFWLILALCISAPLNAEVDPTFFGMDLSKGIMLGEPWPVDTICVNPFQGCDGFGGIRLWDSGVSWDLMNPAPGQYDWSMFDAWLNAAQTNGVDIEYTFGRVPQWASSDPGRSTCTGSGGGGPGKCAPPNDLNADGTGTDQHWIDFVTAIATRSAGRVHYWEMWNEGGNPARWAGTSAQLVRMVSDARSIILGIDPTAVILSPSGGIRSPVELNWWKNFLAAGGGTYVDAIAIHSYLQTEGHQPVPEELLVYLPQFVAKYLTPYGQNTKPIIDTEASWGNPNCCNFSNPDLQAGFVVRYYVMHLLANVQRYYWFAWDDATAGTLWVADPHDITKPGTLLKPGIAYQQTYNWFVGNTLDPSCTPNGSVWACNITGANGYQGQIVWDTSQTCKAGTCTYSNYTFNPMFIQYVTIYGQVIPVNGSTVPIGYQPILLQNMTPAKRR